IAAVRHQVRKQLDGREAAVAVIAERLLEGPFELARVTDRIEIDDRPFRRRPWGLDPDEAGGRRQKHAGGRDRGNREETKVDGEDPLNPARSGRGVSDAQWCYRSGYWSDAASAAS